MIIDDDLDPKTKKIRPRQLDNMSVHDLRDYIAQLQNEITRVEADIQKKESHRAGLDALFSKRD